jgi:hypothetical protein
VAYRGRLIFPVVAEVFRLDLASTAADPDGAGPLTTGIDPIYREPIKLPSVDRVGSSARKEFAAVKLPVQIEPTSLSRLSMIGTGDASVGRIVGVFLMADLEGLSLVNASTGEALLRRGDRLGAVYKMDGTLIQKITNPPGLFISEVVPLFGLGGDRNLLQVAFESRLPGK